MASAAIKDIKQGFWLTAGVVFFLLMLSIILGLTVKAGIQG
jgi:hypothetical protein